MLTIMYQIYKCEIIIEYSHHNRTSYIFLDRRNTKKLQKLEKSNSKDLYQFLDKLSHLSETACQF